ncbi:MAG TPA: ATP synthase F0 subunit B [Bryobacteraceae bacterium]|nr:ATP synthase F0 subunit B [Bryobacteraceae bacterium]
MNSTLQGLITLLIQSVPTIVFFIVLTYYLKYIFFRPIQRILDERRRATEGIRELAEKANAVADQELSEFERALHQARHEIYKNNDELRKQWSEEQMVALEKARAEAAEKLASARRLIDEEFRQAEGELQTVVEPLSEEIVHSLLRRRAA